MKILIVSQYFWPEAFRINDLALGLLERGHHVTVLTGIPNYPEGHFYAGYGFLKRMRENYQGIEVIRIPLCPRGKAGPIRLALNYFTFALMGFLLGPLLCRGKFDRIFVYQPSPVTVGLPAIALKRAKKAPVIFWVQDLWPESVSAIGYIKSDRWLGMVARLVRFIYRRCDLILVQSRAFLPSIEKLGVSPGKIRYFPNYAESLYKPVPSDPADDEARELPEGFRVMFAGNIGVGQDFPNILAAAHLLKERKDIQWVILGEGSMRAWLESQIASRGLSDTVHLLGRRPAEAMPRYFSHADALLVTLKKEPIFALTIPSKIQSYLACARPIIGALDGEGVRVIREAGAGVTCSSENPQELSKLVLSLAEMSGRERRTMGEQGRLYFEKHFDRKILLDRLETWMKEVSCL